MISCRNFHSFIISLIGTFTWLTPPGPYRATTCRERELTLDHILFTTQGHGEPPRMSDQLNSGATHTWKTMNTIHAPIHCNKANMKGWIWRPNDIRSPYGPKASWHVSYRWGKTPKKPRPETCPDRGPNPGPLRDTRMVPPVPQRWTIHNQWFYFNKLYGYTFNLKIQIIPQSPPLLQA